MNFLMWDQPHAVMTALHELLGVEAWPRREGAEVRDNQVPLVWGPLI